MPKYWMITNRNIVENEGFGDDHAPTTYWSSDKGPLDNFKNWKKESDKGFKLKLIGAADKFPFKVAERHEEQKHVCIFIHGFDNTWQDAARRYESLNKELFEGEEGMGICVLFNWPSNGSVIGYYPDRKDARKSAQDLSEVLNALYDWLLKRQIDTMEEKDPTKSCRAKTSVIAHSMGNYVLQNAMQYTWTRKNQPLLVSLINQLVMVAADVDNDLFKCGEGSDKSDGDAIANLTYRVTALYTGLDTVLGMSAGLKHFGKRRLGRSGLDRSYPIPDNVWDIDCTSFLKDESNVHSAYFENPDTLNLMRKILRGIDRKVITQDLPQI